MIARTYRKYANELGLEIKNGVAVGAYKGYMLTLEEGSGWKSVAVAARCAGDDVRLQLQGFLADKSTAKSYRVRDFQITDQGIQIVFLDNPGTMKRIRAFVELFLDMLTEKEVKGIGYCAHCGMEIGPEGADRIMIGGLACEMHAGCAASLQIRLTEEYEETKSSGSIASGIIGALIGALVGAIPWAVAYYAGWFVAVLGLIVGLASMKGYDYLRGKECRAKPIIVMLATVVAVLIANIVAIAVGVMIEFSGDPEMAAYSYTFLDCLGLVFLVLREDPEFLIGFVKDMLMGLLFAGLGVFGTIRGMFRMHSKKNREVRKI